MGGRERERGVSNVKRKREFALFGKGSAAAGASRPTLVESADQACQHAHSQLKVSHSEVKNAR